MNTDVHSPVPSHLLVTLCVCGEEGARDMWLVVPAVNSSARPIWSFQLGSPTAAGGTLLASF